MADGDQRAKETGGAGDREALLRAIIETSPDGLVTIDRNGSILSFNPAAEMMFGYAAAEVVGRNIRCLMPSPYGEEHDGYMARYLKTGEKKIIGIGRQVLAKKKSGDVFPIDLAVGEVELASTRMFAGFIRDISARQAVEQNLSTLRGEMLHVSRLSEMGEMASALAHELNQPLTAIINYLDACHRMVERDGQAAQSQVNGLMRKASDQASRAGQIIQQLRKFIAKGETERGLQAINDVVEEAAQLALVGARQHRIVTSFDLADALPKVMIDRVQIQQVIINLVRNSIDALVEVDRRELVLRTQLSAPSTLEVAVIDTGAGLAKEVADRLFQTFVTTKPDGIGIGLSICRGIVDAHGGTLEAFANPGGGTIFALHLPVDRRDRT